MARDNYRFACRADVSKQELKEVLRLEKCCEMACVRYQLDLFDRRDDIIKVFPRHFGRRQHILLPMKDEERDLKTSALLPCIATLDPSASVVRGRPALRMTD